MDQNSIAEQILYVEPIFELTISLPSLIANIYFAFRFSRLQCFSPNLRVLLVMSNIITSISTVTHSVAQLIPQDSYSVERGQYFGACVVYFLHFVTMIMTIIVDSKFLLISIERTYAFHHRKEYESRDDGSGAKQVLSYYFSSVTLLVLIKCVIMFSISTEKSMDERLAWTFVAERCVWLFVSNALLASTTWIGGAVHFFCLSRSTKRTRKEAKTLSERFQLEQCKKVTDVMLPLLAAFAVGILYSGSCMIVLLYLYFIAGHHTTSVYYMIFANAAYYSMPVYSAYVTGYQCYYFRSMRGVIINDLRTILGIHVEDTSVHPTRRDPHIETSMYFEELKQMWK